MTSSSIGEIPTAQPAPPVEPANVIRLRMRKASPASIFYPPGMLSSPLQDPGREQRDILEDLVDRERMTSPAQIVRETFSNMDKAREKVRDKWNRRWAKFFLESCLFPAIDGLAMGNGRKPAEEVRSLIKEGKSLKVLFEGGKQYIEAFVNDARMRILANFVNRFADIEDVEIRKNPVIAAWWLSVIKTTRPEFYNVIDEAGEQGTWWLRESLVDALGLIKGKREGL